MSKRKLTPWFPPEIKPLHQGVYRTKFRDWKSFTGRPEYQFWNGSQWGPVNSTPGAAFKDRTDRSFYQENHWCGLAEKPE